MADNNSNNGISFTSLLTIAFIVLKLCKVITWSWWWVLSPVWISIGLLIIVLIFIGIYKWRQSIDTKKRLASGMNPYAWKNRNKKDKLRDRIEALKKSNMN